MVYKLAGTSRRAHWSTGSNIRQGATLIIFFLFLTINFNLVNQKRTYILKTTPYYYLLPTYY